MKTEELKALGLNGDQVQKVFALYGAEVNDWKQQVTDLTAQLQNAHTRLADYDPDWKQKTEQAQQKAEQQIAELKSRYAEANAAAGLPFTSMGARKAFLADLAAKKLPVQQDGTLEGFDSYLELYKKNDPGAFATEGGYPNVKDGGDPRHNPTGSTREQFAAWFEQVMQ